MPSRGPAGSDASVDAADGRVGKASHFPLPSLRFRATRRRKKKQNLLLNTCPPFSPQPQTSLLILIIFIIQSFSSSPKPHPRSKCDPPPRTLSHPSFLSQIAAARVPAPLPSSYKRLVWTTTQERYATRRLITAPFFSA
ncbi:hypothetical protein PDE_00528 [Penicillium oxalicum 114-2]|uniref:Uncharacterized protein n=1 Tax=Penicillium oxalicum (strain 114-2 / CGMCC 5302) TaxID=933388 RepID=S7Z640_PENO1|nr:hypothetical protein PDE_00528 [Penicillium oxalicum 114-2]